MARIARTALTPRPTARRSTLGRRSAVAALAGAALVLTGCTGGDSVAEQAKAGDNKGYVAGDGQIVQYAPDERAEPVELAGETLEGDTWETSEHEGSVVVVNSWASWCGPCEKEAPELVATHEAYADEDDVEFIGIDYREPSKETGRAQAQAWGLPYDSIYDDAGTSAIQMQSKLSTTPATAVLDRQGRIASVVLGPVTESTLSSLIDDALEETSG